MPRRKIDFRPGRYYHLYNRGCDRQNIFFEQDNYLYFLRQFRRYLGEQTVHVIAYCLMPNHYHFLGHRRPKLEYRCLPPTAIIHPNSGMHSEEIYSGD